MREFVVFGLIALFIFLLPVFIVSLNRIRHLIGIKIFIDDVYRYNVWMLTHNIGYYIHNMDSGDKLYTFMRKLDGVDPFWYLFTWSRSKLICTDPDLYRHITGWVDSHSDAIDQYIQQYHDIRAAIANG